MSYQTECSSCVWLGEACVAHADPSAIVSVQNVECLTCGAKPVNLLGDLTVAAAEGWAQRHASDPEHATVVDKRVSYGKAR